MELDAVKPLLTSLVLPLAFLVLVTMAGLLMAAGRRRKGLLVSAASASCLWLLSCHGAAVWLAGHALPQYPPITAAQLKASKVQAIVVLGGGIYVQAPEYGQAQPGPDTAARLRYGVWLARQTGLPVAFAGGLGWAAAGSANTSEAEVAGRVAAQEYGVALRWLEALSRDTAENASLLTPMLKRDGITKIALVTDALHMPRSVLEFERHGLVVVAAPRGFVVPNRTALLQWLPSAEGISASTRVVHEVLGLAVAKLR